MKYAIITTIMEKYAIQKIILRKLTKKKAYEKSQFVQELALLLIEENPKRKVKPEYLIRKKIRKMYDDGLIEEYETNFSTFITLTKAGKQRLTQMELLSSNSILPRKWDGLWRVVVVNATREEKDLQDSLRYILKKAHFVPLKSSIWISPFPLEEVIAEVKKNLELEGKLFVFLAHTIDSFTQEEMEEIYLQKITKEK